MIVSPGKMPTGSNVRGRVAFRRGGWIAALAGLAIAGAAPLTPARATGEPTVIPPDATAAALDRCLDLPGNASTAAQIECQAAALRDYDRRMNAAYLALMRRLPVAAGTRLRTAQRAWIAFRDSERVARAALYATRDGTMYRPMQVADEVAVTRDRARQLEGLVWVMNPGG